MQEERVKHISLCIFNKYNLQKKKKSFQRLEEEMAYQMKHTMKIYGIKMQNTCKVTWKIENEKMLSNSFEEASIVPTQHEKNIKIKGICR